MIEKTPLISIVIRTKNEEKGLPKLLQCIRNQIIDKNYEIIIVDSGSTDRTLEIAKKSKLKIIKIKSDTFSYGKALNIGIGNSLGDIVIFVSAHIMILSNSWLKNLIQPILDENIKCTYGKLIGNSNVNPFEELLWKSMYPEKDKTFSKLTQSKSLKLSNSNAAYHKSIFKNLKFNENIPYAEDRLMGFQLLKKKIKIKYVHSSKTYHTHQYKFKTNFLRSIKIGYSIDFINFKIFNVKKSVIRIFYEFLKNNIGELLNYVKILLIKKNKKFLLNLCPNLISKNSGRLIGEMLFSAQNDILQLKKKN
ncbi:MAG: glycosyltransferase family 2 protein [Promethearchaeota archaeon]